MNGIAVLFIFNMIQHSNNKNSWKRVSRLITKISPTKLKKRENSPWSNKPATKDDHSQWIQEMPLSIHNNKHCYRIELRVRARFFRHLSNFYLHDTTLCGSHLTVVRSVAILEKPESHSLFHYLGINFFTTNMGRYTTLFLPENDRMLKSSERPFSRVKAHWQTNRGYIHQHTHLL